MRRLILGVVLLVFGLACTAAQAEPRGDPKSPTLMVLMPQQGDTALAYVIGWLPPAVGGNVGQIQVYDTRLIDAVTGDTVAIGAATAAPDTLYGPLVVEDSIHVYAVVRAVNQFGREGPWSDPSPTLHAFIPSMAPGPPTDVTVDTLQRYSAIYRLELRPKGVVVGRGTNLLMEFVAFDDYGFPVACEAATFTAVDSVATITDGGVCTNTQVVAYDSLSWNGDVIVSSEWAALVGWTVAAKAEPNQFLVTATAAQPPTVGLRGAVGALLVELED